MCNLEDENQSLDNIVDDLFSRLEQDNKNINRVKKLYHDDDTFDNLMNHIIEKDPKRFEKLVKNKNSDQIFPTPWKMFGYIMDIVQTEGEEIKPFDTITRMLPCRLLVYHGWTFCWVHGISTMVSIYNPKNELVYRF